ncbi:hypothetical protein PG991_003624 [Apiospora marii]|uniref:Store-operated calcium entry-associated regulatory factor n=1 Tax=Apiospora marii TaxID=335849 RepID=A0ABR1S477_9PEZI
MHLPLAPAALGALLLATATPAHAAQKPKNAILPLQVKTLTLRGAGAQTTHRRVPAMPQLQCQSSKSLCRLHEIDVMRCTNQGAAYETEDIQWSCTASLPPELKLGGTEVMCEGYAGPDDDYVLKGSCGVQYRLVLTEAGEKRYPDLAGGGGGGGGWNPDTGGIDAGGILFGILFVGVLAWMVYSACVNANGTNGAVQRRPRGGGGGGGGGGWGPRFDDDNNDPPPPYSSKPRSSAQQQQQQGWRPGFWTGAASGAAAGYFAGNRGNRQQQPPQRNYGSGWGGGSGSSSWGAGPSFSSSSSSSSDRHESTGFGGTSRR